MTNWLRIIATAGVAILFLPFSAKAGTWIDEDGGTIVHIDANVVSIYSLDNFYYFDEVFSSARDGVGIRVCFGVAHGTGMASDCVSEREPEIGFHNKGKNRALHFLLDDYPFLIEAFELYLSRGYTMKVSIDNGDLFSAYTVNKDYALSDEAQRILDLPD